VLSKIVSFSLQNNHETSIPLLQKLEFNDKLSSIPAMMQEKYIKYVGSMFSKSKLVPLR